MINTPIYSRADAERAADVQIAALNEPMAGAGMSTSYGAPRAGRIVREMRMAPTHAGAIEMMKANPDETVMFEPGEEVPPADAIADAVEQVQDQGLLTKIWNMIKQTVDPPPMTPEEKARAQEEFSAMLRDREQRMANPQTMGDKINKFLSDVPEEAFRDISTTSEGYEPGSYRAEGDRRISEVSVGVSRWNILAGTEK